MLLEKLTDSLHILNENYNIEDPLFLKQVLLLTYYFSNTNETIDADVISQFEKLQEKCYNDIVKEDDGNQRPIAPMSEQKNTARQHEAQSCDKPKAIYPEKISLIDQHQLSLATTTTFFPAFRNAKQLSSISRKRS